MNRLHKVAAVSGGLLAAGALVVGGVASHAVASPPADERSPIGGEHAHTHHIHTGNGDCVEIDEVRFEPGAHGVHHATNTSSADMWHGTCDGKVYPGGPPLPPFVEHH